MIPRPPDPARVRFPVEPLPRLAFGAAWRTRALGHALAHGLRRVPGGEPQRLVLARIDRMLRLSDTFAAHPALAASDGAHGEILVQARLRLEPLPYCESWAEVAMADAIYGRALDLAVEGLGTSADGDLARAARSAAAAAPCAPGPLDELARDAANASCLQILADRWLGAAVHVFGAPGSAGDEQATRARLRPSVDESLARYLAEIERTIWDWGLEAADAMLMGVVVPGGWAPRRLSRKPREH
jgi:hypothetical protein